MGQSYNKQRLLRLLTQTIPALASAEVKWESIGGLSSESWRISVDGQVWLARPQTGQGQQLGTNRQREYQLLRQMSGCQLAPKPLICHDGWLVVEWVTGRPCTPDEFVQFMEQGDVAQLLCTLHQQPCCGYDWALPALFARDWQCMDPRRRSPVLLRWHQHFQRCALPDALAQAPLHLDVHAENLLITPDHRLRLIDWEYAANGDIGFELTFLLRGNPLTAAQQQRFLQHYQRLRPGFSLAALTRSVGQWAPWVDYLILMWFEVRWHQTQDASFLAAGASARRRLGLAE